MANRNQSANSQALARLSEVQVTNVRRTVAHSMEAEVRQAKSLSNRFKWLRKNFTGEVTDYLIDLKKKGKPINEALVQRILVRPDFALFKSFMTEKQASKDTYTGYEVLGILGRAVCAKPEVIEAFDSAE